MLNQTRPNLLQDNSLRETLTDYYLASQRDISLSQIIASCVIHIIIMVIDDNIKTRYDVIALLI